jgi:dipeptidyl aminopeptidase/acylaminoacyl peptidase
MKFEDIQTPVISSQGNWIAYGVWPDRGDGKVVVQHTSKKTSYEIELGARPEIAHDENWLVVYKNVPIKEELKSGKDKPKRGLSILNLENGDVRTVEQVSSYSLSNDGKWLAISKYQSEDILDLKHKNKKLGTKAMLWDLENDESIEIDFVAEMSFDSLSNFFSYSVIDTSGEGNGIFLLDLNSSEKSVINSEENGFYSNLTWDTKSPQLAFTKAVFDSNYVDSDASLHIWNASESNLKTLITPDDIEEGWALRSNNDLRFVESYEFKRARLFFGLMPRSMVDLGMKNSDDDDEIDIYDVEKIIEDRGMDLWHGDDPRIKTHEIVTFNSRKNRIYTAVYHLDDDEWVQLADLEMPFIQISDGDRSVIGSTDEPYLRDITYDGFFQDYYLINLDNGKRTLIAERLSSTAMLTPKGHRVLFYQDKNWHVYNVDTEQTRSITNSLKNLFYNEDHDYPSEVPSYGMGGWVDGGDAALIYDKYDIWQIPLIRGNIREITDGKGREEKRIFRVRSLDGDNKYRRGDEILLTSYHDLKKNFGFYSAKLEEEGVKKLLEEDKKFTFVSKADDSEKILFKREAYDEFPNLWVSNDWKFKKTKQVSKLHMDLKKKWNWGSAELVDWLSLDGTYIQGIVIKPDNYDPNKRYPIMTYYYRFFSERLHDFNEPKTNHRPVFAQYVSDDYVVFLPDIRFEIGRPGFAATKSLVPGIQKLIEMGIADEDKLGLHGHSWSGYQTAFIVTQTDIFDAAVTGAPVSNMTSAYSGIRWGSGLARQFQYEKTQSRIGESLIEAPEKYIENSPVFFADKITTPMLIQHGDADGAVPWYQSIELYLAMRRYNKDVIFLQYHDEPHHLQKFPNKLDYAIRMKEYFDYYLKGVGEPEWILSGETFQGR